MLLKSIFRHTEMLVSTGKLFHILLPRYLRDFRLCATLTHFGTLAHNYSLRLYLTSLTLHISRIYIGDHLDTTSAAMN